MPLIPGPAQNSTPSAMAPSSNISQVDMFSMMDDRYQVKHGPGGNRVRVVRAGFTL